MVWGIIYPSYETQAPPAFQVDNLFKFQQ